MKQLPILILLYLTFINSELSAQEVRLDPDFGKNGALDIKDEFITKVFVDQKSNSIFIGTSIIKKDGFSSNFNYYVDQLQKINATTGKHDPQFGKKGIVTHTINSTNRSCCNSQWSESETKIICNNLDADDKDVLIFSKVDGSFTTIPKYGINDDYRFISGMYYDESNNQFLVGDDYHLWWYDSKGNKNEIRETAQKSISRPLVQTSDKKVLLPLSEYNPLIDSTKFKWKFLSLENNFDPIPFTTETSAFTYLKKWKNNKASFIEITTDSIRCKFDPLSTNDTWESIEYSAPNETTKLFIDKIDKAIYILSKEATYKEPYLGEEYGRTIKSQSYDLVKLDFKTGNVVRKNIDNLLPYETNIINTQHIGNEEFIIFASVKKRKKWDYYLFKIILN